MLYNISGIEGKKGSMNRPLGVKQNNMRMKYFPFWYVPVCIHTLQNDAHSFHCESCSRLNLTVYTLYSFPLTAVSLL